MVWILKAKSSETRYAILPKKIYVVGRLNSDIIADDKTVSRKHATLELRALSNSGSKEKLLPEYEIVLIDVSKFGSFLNRTTPLLGKEVVLKESDEVTFGQQPGVTFIVQQEPLNVFTSCLKPSEKRQLKSSLEQLGDVLYNDWKPQCTHLVMSTLTATFKVICSLLQAIPIVTVNYFEALVQYYTDQGPNHSRTAPKYIDYLPVVTDEHINMGSSSFLPNSRRSQIFTNKTFVFLSEAKMEGLRPLLELGNAKCHLLSERDLSRSNSEDAQLLHSPDTLLIYEPVTNSLRSKAFAILKRCNRRPVLDAEIGHAVLKNSLDYYCNTSIPCDPHLYKDTISSEAFSQNPFHIETSKPASNLKRKFESGTFSSPAKRASIDAPLPKVEALTENTPTFSYPAISAPQVQTNSSSRLDSGSKVSAAPSLIKPASVSTPRINEPESRQPRLSFSPQPNPINKRNESGNSSPIKTTVNPAPQVAKFLPERSSRLDRSKFNLFDENDQSSPIEEEMDPFDAIVVTKGQENNNKPFSSSKSCPKQQNVSTLSKTTPSEPPRQISKYTAVSRMPSEPSESIQSTVKLPVLPPPSKVIPCEIKTNESTNEDNVGFRNCGLILKSNLYRSNQEGNEGQLNFKNFRKANRAPIFRPTIHLVASSQISKKLLEL